MNKSGIVKRITAIILSLMLCAALFPLTIAFADNDNITTFDELKAFFETGGSGKLMEDINLGNERDIFIDKNITLDLNGHTLRGNRGENETSITLNVKSGSIFNNSDTDSTLYDVRICVPESETFTFSNIHFENCKTESKNVMGGAIEIKGSAEITDCTFTGCEAKNSESSNGGAVYVNSTGDAKISGCDFTGCEAKNSNNCGGAAAVSGEAEISRCTFTDCCAAQNGGAVYVDSTGDAEISDCDFTDCKTNLKGGAVYIIGGNTRISECTFSDCISEDGNGGAVGVENRSTAYVTDCTFSSCEADASGGAVYEYDSSYFEISGADTSIEDCSAGSHGGGICAKENTVIKDISITRCEAVNGGGGIEGSPSISGVTISSCTAGENGGGIYGSPAINGVTISGCRAGGNGGGIYIAFPQNICIEKAKVTGCTAEGDGGGIGLYAEIASLIDVEVTGCEAAGYSGGGGIDVWLDYTSCDSPELTLTGDCVILGNTASGKTNNLLLEEYSEYDVKIEDPGDKMNVGITLDDPTMGVFSTPCASDYSSHFFSDDPAYAVISTSNNELKLVPGKSVIIEPSEHGSVTADKTGFIPTDANRTVTLTVAPAQNYKLKSITAKTDESTPADVQLTKVDDTTYTFEMPTDSNGKLSANVTVKAEFEEDAGGTGGGKDTQTITATAPRSIKYGDSGKKIEASVSKDGGALSFTVSAGSDVISIDPATGVITVLKSGSAEVTVTAAATDKYEQATQKVSLTVGKADLTITADDKSVRKGGTMPELTCTSEGLVGSDTLPKGYKPVCADADTDKVGKYDITLPAVTDADFLAKYDIKKYNKGVFEVTEDYKVTEGAGQSYVKGSEETAFFRANGEYFDFVELQVDGDVVSTDDYKVWEGSTCVRLKNKFLESLDIGKHTLTFIYKDGKCSCKFYVTRFKGAPITGDSFQPLIWVNIMFFSGLVMYYTAAYRKRKYSLSARGIQYITNNFKQAPQLRRPTGTANRSGRNGRYYH